MIPALDARFKLHRLAVRPEGRHRRRRQLDPPVMAVLAVPESAAVFRPRALHMHPATWPVEVGAVERRRLAPPEPAPEAHHQERVPARLQLPAGREQRRGLLRREPLEIPPARSQGVLAGPLVLDGRAELLLEVARQGVAARARVPPDGDLHLAGGVDVDEDRGTWHRNLLAGRAGRVTGPRAGRGRSARAGAGHAARCARRRGSRRAPRRCA